MGVYLLQFLVKSNRPIVICATLISFVIFCSWGITKITDAFVPAFASVMAERLKINITFEKAKYVFPKQIVLKNVKVFDSKVLDQPMLEIPKVSLDFSFPLFFSSGNIHLDQMTLTHMSSHIFVLKNYLGHNSVAVWQELKQLPQSNIKIFLTDTKIYLFQENKIVEPLKFNMDFSLLKGKFMGKFKDGASFLQLWGNWRGDSLNWNGYMFYTGSLMKEPINILDIDGRLNVGSKDIVLEKMSFNVNGDQFVTTGHWQQQDNMPFDIKVSYAKHPKHVSLQSPLKNVNLSLRGQYSQSGRFNVDGHVDFDLFLDKNLSVPLQKGSLEFIDMETNIINDKLFQLKANQVKGLSWFADKGYPFALDNLLASIQRKETDEYIVNLSTNVYGGKYEGRVNLDCGTQPWQIQSQGKFDQIQIHRLSEIFSHFSSIQGVLGGQINLQAPRNSFLSGHLQLHKGDFTDFIVLPWDVSKTLQAPSLDHISMAELSLRFKADSHGAIFDDFKFDSQHLRINGWMKLDNNSLISSKVSVYLSEQLLAESPFGQKILSIAPEAVQMPFEFRFSGSFDKVNFQWQDSELKKKIEERIPNFIENIIQRRIEDKILSNAQV